MRCLCGASHSSSTRRSVHPSGANGLPILAPTRRASNRYNSESPQTHLWRIGQIAQRPAQLSYLHIFLDVYMKTVLHPTTTDQTRDSVVSSHAAPITSKAANYDAVEYPQLNTTGSSVLTQSFIDAHLCFPVILCCFQAGHLLLAHSGAGRPEKGDGGAQHNLRGGEQGGARPRQGGQGDGAVGGARAPHATSHQSTKALNTVIPVYSVSVRHNPRVCLHAACV